MKKSVFRRIGSALSGALFFWVLSVETVALADVVVDPALPVYEKASGVSGKVVSVGSDTLANLMTFWAEAFKRLYPHVGVQIQAAGSSTAPPALINGAASFGPMSRLMKKEELSAFEKKYGYPPTAIGVAIDGLAVYVNKDNPIAKRGMTMAEVDAVFSSTRRCGGKSDITRWDQLGLGGAWRTRHAMQVYGRNSASGTYGFFKRKALCKGDFKDTVNEQPGSASVVQSVSRAIGGIGYSGIGYRSSGVVSVPLAKTRKKPFITPSEDKVLSGEYPLARLLYVYVNKPPNRALPPLTKEFIKMVLSKTGQKMVGKDGYIPLSAALADTERAKLDSPVP